MKYWNTSVLQAFQPPGGIPPCAVMEIYPHQVWTDRPRSDKTEGGGNVRGMTVAGEEVEEVREKVKLTCFISLESIQGRFPSTNLALSCH